jgi:arginine-tRNA-protein transferase
MLVQTYFPERLAASRYDTFLASGWFRGSVMLYKMDLLCLEEEIYSVVNIRLNINDFTPRKSHRKILRKAQQNLTLSFGPAEPDAAKEALYHLHKKKFKGFIHPTLEDYLNSGYNETVFDTHEARVYDGDKLVAVSYFDLGHQSMASLLGLYDESYKHYSPGFLTMLMEIEFGRKHGFKWYYPGYVLDQPSQFNYKLRLGDFEYYNPNKRWANYEHFNPTETQAYLLKSKIDELKDALQRLHIGFEEVLYPLFSMGYVSYWNAEFVKYPVFLLIDQGEEEKYLLSYDLDLGLFTVIKAVPAPHYAHLVNMETSGDFKKGSRYAMQLLMVSDHVASGRDAELLCESL